MAEFGDTGMLWREPCSSARGGFWKRIWALFEAPGGTEPGLTLASASILSSPLPQLNAKGRAHQRLISALVIRTS